MVCGRVALLRALLCILLDKNHSRWLVSAGFADFSSNSVVSTFSELDGAVEEGAKSIVVTGPEIVFLYPLVLYDASVLSVEGNVTGETTLSGDGGTLFVLNGGSFLSLRGITLAHCGAVAVDMGLTGGAVRVYSDSVLVMESVRASYNTAVRGAVVYAGERARVLLSDCTLASNWASWGGAIHAQDGSTITLLNSTLALNTASQRTAVGGAGGAVSAEGATVTATDCTMSSNYAVWGGAVYSVGASTVIVTDCAMTSNSAFSAGGAALASGSSAFTATDCTMTSNSAPSGGAVSAIMGSTATTTGCTMTLHLADYGGVVHAEDKSTATATDCTMTSNSAHWGETGCPPSNSRPRR